MIYWEQRKLLSITTMHARIGWQNLRTTEFLEDGKYLLITGTDFVDGKIDFTRCYYVKQERYNQDRNIQIKNGCLLITKDGTLGKVAYVNGLNKPATLNAGIFNVEIRDENKVDRLYLYQYIKAPFLLEYVNQMATGGTIKHLNQNILVDFMVSMPQIVEQKKIGELFQTLDHLITLHQSKSFGHILKAIVSCTLSWEQRKLGECFTERIESMPNGKLISVTINDGIKKFSELGRHDNSNDDKSKYKKVCVGDIAYNSMRMWQGASGYSPYEGIVSPAYTVLAANHGVNSRCIAHQFKLSKMIHTFKINSQGITSDNWNLKFPALSDIPIYISKQIDEQCKIAFFLENLDHLITLHQLEPFQLIFKAIAYRIIDYAKSKPPRSRK